MGVRVHNALLGQRDRLGRLRGADASTSDGEGWRLVDDPVNEGAVHGVLSLGRLRDASVTDLVVSLDAVLRYPITGVMHVQET